MPILSYVISLSANYSMKIRDHSISRKMTLCCKISMLFLLKNLKFLLLLKITSYFGLCSLIYLRISFLLPPILLLIELIKMPQTQDLKQFHQCGCISQGTFQKRSFFVKGVHHQMTSFSF